MMGLLRVGFFRELRHGRADGPSLRECLRESAQPDEVAIAQYLNAGATLAATGSLVDDYLDGAKKAVAPLEIATDGRWAWPRDLAYYVREYHVEIPAEFVSEMRQRGWNPPEFAPEDMKRLETEYLMS